MRSKFRGRAVRSLLNLALFFLMTACAGTNAPGKEILWSSPASGVEIHWVMEIRQQEDAGIRPNFWKSIADLVTGRPPVGIGQPYGIFVDRHDRLFVADPGRALVHVFDRPGGKYWTIGGPPHFLLPIGIGGDDDNLFIGDSAAGVVFRYDLHGNSLRPFIRFPQGRPTGIAFSRTNQLLYVTDTQAHQVVVFDREGSERFRIGNRGERPGEFNYPTDLFLDEGGNLYVTDSLNARIQVFSATGRFLRMFGSPGDSAGSFAKPKGVAVDREGRVYVCDAMQDEVQILDEEGRALMRFGENGVDAGEFWMPSGMHIDHRQFIYVADTYNRRIQVFHYTVREE